MAEQSVQPRERRLLSEIEAIRPHGMDGGEGDGQAPVLVGGDGQIPLPAEEVLDVEGPAQHMPRPEQQRDALSIWLFRRDVKAQAVDRDELAEVVARDENFVWVDLSEYDVRELEALTSPLQLPERAVRATVAQWQRPTLDLFDDQFFVSATVAHLDSDARRVRAGQLDLFVGRNFLLSAHKRPLPFADRIMARARRSPELVQLDSAFMLYIMLDELLAYYEGLSEHLEDEIEQMEERALTDTSDRFLGDLLQFKRYVFALTRLADQHRTVFPAFRRPDFPFVGGERVEPYYRDLEERLQALLAMLLATKEAVNGTFDIYVSHVSHRTNHVIKILTMVSTILLPTTLILGFFGTNFEGVPMYQPAFLIVMLVSIVLITAGILLAYRRSGWF